MIRKFLWFCGGETTHTLYAQNWDEAKEKCVRQRIKWDEESGGPGTKYERFEDNLRWFEKNDQLIDITNCTHID
jgi:hypothetical protein